MELPTSPAVHRNKTFILDVLKQYIPNDQKSLLEIGSGTGEHAVFFANEFPNLNWQTSDSIQGHQVINAYREQAGLENVLAPLTYLAGHYQFPKGQYDFVFNANALHIMNWENAKCLFMDLGENLSQGNLVFLYGPFNYEGKFTSESNANFDKMLRDRGLGSAIRDFELVNEHLEKAGFKLLKDHEMPANNRLLVFQRL